MNITPEIPRLDPVRVQVRRHALMNEINRKPARRGWRLAVPATGLAAAVTIGAVWWTTPAPPQVADDPALAGQCDLALARAEPDRPFTAPKSAVVERREQIALVVMIHFETRWFCVFDGRSQIVARKSDGSLAADDGATATTRFRAVNEGWVSITRPWHLLTKNSGSGNPHAATPEKGRQLVNLLVDRLAEFLVELSKADLDERFPF